MQDTPKYFTSDILKQIEREVVNARVKQGNWPEEDKHASPEDWVALITAYAGRCVDARINKHEEDFQDLMCKVAGLAVSAMYADRMGWV